jgi:hypothetical protein
VIVGVVASASLFVLVRLDNLSMGGCREEVVRAYVFA